MSKDFYCLLSVLLISFPAYSQIADSVFLKVPWIYNEAQDSALGHKAAVNYGIQNNSTTITNALTWKYLSGKTIGNKERTDLKAQLLAQNRVGFDLGYGMEYSWFRKKIAYSLKVRRNNHLDAAFTGDLFRIITEGNKPFAGSTANFDGSNLHFVKYDQVSLGIIKRVILQKDMGAFYSASVSYLAGHQNLMLDVPRGRLFTQQDGEYLEADFDYTFHGAGFDSRSDTAN